jgi:hypothetical protein
MSCVLVLLMAIDVVVVVVLLVLVWGCPCHPFISKGTRVSHLVFKAKIECS